MLIVECGFLDTALPYSCANGGGIIPPNFSYPCAHQIPPHSFGLIRRFAASHIKDVGPTLNMSAEYAIPAGSGDDPAIDEEGNEVVDDVRLT